MNITITPKQSKSIRQPSTFNSVDTWWVQNELGNMMVRVTSYNTTSASTAYVWVRFKDEVCFGSAKATGYGYHRPSEAIEAAFYKAGISIDDETIGGAGDSAVTDAVKAIARFIGMDNPTIIALSL